MARTNCRACGATVDMVETRDGHVPLETVEDPATSADRYVIVSHTPLRAVRVAGSSIRGLPDHRYDCPGANAGRS